MNHTTYYLHELEQKLFSFKRDWSPKHPWLVSLLLVVFMPVFIVGAVAGLTAAIMYPLSWILGWL